MGFEKPSANVSKHKLGDRVEDVIDSDRLIVVNCSCFDGVEEQFFEIAKGELIHGVD